MSEGARDVADNRWWRFDSYELGTAGHIQPAQGAQLIEYSPWAEYIESRASSRADVASTTPYLELDRVISAVVNNTGPMDWRMGEISPAHAEAICRWAERWGLLGILSQDTALAALSPRWNPFPGPDDDLVVAGQTFYKRTPRGWKTDFPPKNFIVGEYASSPLQRDASLSGRLLDAAETPDTWLPPLVITSMQAEGGGAATLPLERAWGPYFPGVPEAERATAQYPLPLTEEFWRGYAEPLWSFLQRAYALIRSIRVVSQLPALATSLSELGPAEQPSDELTATLIDVRDAMAKLEGFASSVLPILGVEEDRIQMRWTCTSLLGLMAFMAMNDMSSRSLRICECCGRPFIAAAHQSAYCSTKCREREKKRRQKRNRTDNQTVEDDS